jgi:hypothetical protein
MSCGTEKIEAMAGKGGLIRFRICPAPWISHDFVIPEP